jgi:hypothetical protein
VASQHSCDGLNRRSHSRAPIITGTHTVYLEFSSDAIGDPAFVSLHYFSFPVS